MKINHRVCVKYKLNQIIDVLILKNIQNMLYYYFLKYSETFVGGAVASWLVRSTPDRAVRVRDLAGDIALCS